MLRIHVFWLVTLSSSGTDSRHLEGAYRLHFLGSVSLSSSMPLALTTQKAWTQYIWFVCHITYLLHGAESFLRS